MMRTIIAVYNVNWIEAKPLFSFISAFGVKIKGQDTMGDQMYLIKNTHLVIDGKHAEWRDVEGAKDFMKEELAMAIHYEELIHHIKRHARCLG